MGRSLKDQNELVRQSAELMPTAGLANSFKAFGYRADVDLSTDEYVVIHGFSMATLARQSGKYGCKRSERSLWSDLELFIDGGIATKESGDRYRDNQATPKITLWLGRELSASALEARRRVYDAQNDARRAKKAEQARLARIATDAAAAHVPLCHCQMPAVLKTYPNGAKRLVCGKATHRCKFMQFA